MPTSPFCVSYLPPLPAIMLALSTVHIGTQSQKTCPKIPTLRRGSGLPGVCSPCWLFSRQTSRQGPRLISSELAAHGTERGGVVLQFIFDGPVMGKLAKHLELSPCAASPGRLAFTFGPTDNNHKHIHLFAKPTGRWSHWVGRPVPTAQTIPFSLSCSSVLEV